MVGVLGFLCSCSSRLVIFSSVSFVFCLLCSICVVSCMSFFFWCLVCL